MAEEKIKKLKAFNVETPKKELTEQDVIRLIDAYINSPGGLRLKTGIATDTDGWAIAGDGTFTTSKQIISTLATGTAPLSITSTTKVNNLNVDQVDGYDLNQNVTTTGTPTFSALTTTNAINIGGNLNHDGSNIGFFGVAPVARASAYTPSNVSTDRSYDADATTVDELADVLGTLIADLQAYGLLQ